VGFSIFFEIETPEGSVVPAGSFDLEDTDATGNGKGTPQDEHKSMNDPSMSPKENKGSEGKSR
jgi:hypothetical protein